MPEPKPAQELASTKIEPGDTTNIPVTIPGMSFAEVQEAQQTKEQQDAFQRARQAAVDEHDRGKDNPIEMYHLYKSTMDTSYFFKDGSIAIFRRKRFLTNNPVEIAELDYEINRKKNPFLWIDKNEMSADPALETPEAKLRAQLFAEWTAEFARAMDPNQDAGSSATQKITPQSSTGIADVAAGGTGKPSTALSQQMQAILSRMNKK